MYKKERYFPNCDKKRRFFCKSVPNFIEITAFSRKKQLDFAFLRAYNRITLCTKEGEIGAKKAV